MKLIDSTVPVHNFLIRNNNLVDSIAWLDELEDDKLSNMGDIKHAPREEALFSKASTEEHGANNSRCIW